MPTLPASYTTVTLVQQVITPKIGSATTLTSEHIANYIGLAQADVNAVIAKQYSLPMVYDVPVLTNLTTTLAGYYILRRMFTQESPNKSDWVGNWKTDATETLEKLMDKSIELVTSSGTIIARNSGGSVEVWSNTMNYKPTFYEQDMDMLGVDPDKVEDEDDARS